MCLIVDANAAEKMFSQPPHPDAVPALKWVAEGKGHVVYGGLLGQELARIDAARVALRQWVESGKAYLCPAAELDREVRRVLRLALCRSNDHHVIALARFSGSRRLYSYDRALQSDFNDPTLINNPRGKVYTGPKHLHLLRNCPPCKYRKVP
jgi:hypothetical protein